MDTNIEIANGRVFVNGKETVDPVLIGYAILDFAEQKRNISLNNDNKILQIINNEVELNVLNTLIEEKYSVFQNKVCGFSSPFNFNWVSSQILFNLISMIEKGSLVFTSVDLKNK